MNSLKPLVYLLAAIHAPNIWAESGLDEYRLGEYFAAADKLPSKNTAVADYYLGKMYLYGYGVLKNNEQAIKLLSQSANKGFLPAQDLMGRYALAVEHNPENALNWFRKAAENNDINAQLYCAAAYLYGYGANKNPDIAKKYFIMAAKGGNAIAQVALAESFFETRQQSNKQLGLLWLNKALLQKNPRAQLIMAELLSEGTLVEKNPDKAKEFLKMAEMQGYLPALYKNAELALAAKDFNGARSWYEKGAKVKDLTALLALGKLYREKEAPFHDDKTAFLWTLQAAQLGSLEAAQELVNLYQEGIGTNKDDNLAKMWQEKIKNFAKEHKEKNAMVAMSKWLSLDKFQNLAYCGYALNGILGQWTNPNALKENQYNPAPRLQTVTKQEIFQPNFSLIDPNSISIATYFDAYVKSLGEVQLNLDFPQYPMTGESETNKPILAQNLTTKNPNGTTANQVNLPENAKNVAQEVPSLKSLELRAKLGDSLAQFTLAQHYHYGKDVPSDRARAISYYELAAQQQDLRAMYALGILFLKEDPKRALKYLNDAAFKGNAYAQYALGQINETGYKNEHGETLIKPDHEQALGLYQLAAANTFGKAEYRLAELMMRENTAAMTLDKNQKRLALVKELYKGAVQRGVTEARLPLAYFQAMDPHEQNDAYKVALEEAAKNTKGAQLLLGLLYDRGIGTSSSKRQALKWYQKDQNNPVTAFIVGTYLNQDNRSSEEQAQGKKLLEQATKADFSYAYLNLGVLNKRANLPFIEQLDKARNLGNSIAGLLLADYYLAQNKDEEQLTSARNIYKFFAEKGDKNAQLKLGYMLEEALGGPKDANAAENWYLAAAKQNQVLAQFLLGRLNQLGWLSTYPNYNEAKKWYSLAQNNYAKAATALGFLYDTVDDNYAKAYTSYQIAASKNDPVALYDLGLMYETGKGMPVNFKVAEDFYLKAAAVKNPEAMNQLASIYFNGSLGSKYERQGVKWLETAAQLGDRDALYRLGELYETGNYLSRDAAKAITHYEKAASQGHPKAKLALSRLQSQNGVGVSKAATDKLVGDVSVKDNQRLPLR